MYDVVRMVCWWWLSVNHVVTGKTMNERGCTIVKLAASEQQRKCCRKLS